MVITNWAAPLAALLRLGKTATTSLDPLAQPPRGFRFRTHLEESFKAGEVV